MQIRPNRTTTTVTVAIVLAIFLGVNAAQASPIRDKLEGLKTREFNGYVIDAEDKPFGDVVAGMEEVSGLNILPGQFKDVKITWKIRHGMPWQDALEIMLKMINADIQVINENTIEIVPSTRLFVEEADLRMAIFSLARGSGKNVIIDPVAGKITLTLEGVPFEEALNAIAEAGGYRVVKEAENLWRIASPEKLITQLVTERITLRYLWPEAPYRAAMDSNVAIGPKHNERYDAFAPEHQPEENFTVLKALKQMLTRDPADPEKFIGHIEYIPSTNTLVITDVKPKVDEITSIIEEIDRSPFQIMIDVKFVTTTNNDFFEFGVDFTRGLTAAASGASTFIRFPFSRGSSWFTDKLSPFGPGTGGKMTGGTGLGSGSYAGLFVDPDQDGGADHVPYTFGSLDFSQLQATLRLMKSDQGTEIMQRPQILTLNNKEATIFVGNRVRFAQTVAASNQQGGLTFAIEEADSSPVDTGFQLLILPRVVEGKIDDKGNKAPDMIMMTVVPESRTLVGTTSEISGFNKFTTNDGAGGTLSIDLPEIATSSLVTNMILRSNQTAVIGGLVIESDNDQVRHVPFISRIPLLGYLAKSKIHNVTKKNLLIFITPRIVYSEADVQEIFARELHRNRQNLPKKYPEEADGHRTFDIERVYDVLYGRPNPYDSWRKYDEMPGPEGGDNVQPTEPEQKPEPEENYAPEDRWNDRTEPEGGENPETDVPGDTNIEEPRESGMESPESNIEEESKAGREDSDGTGENPPEEDDASPVLPDSGSDKGAGGYTEPTPAEESAPADDEPLSEKERDDSFAPTQPEDQPTEKESFGELDERPHVDEEADAADTEPENGTD